MGHAGDHLRRGDAGPDRRIRDGVARQGREPGRDRRTGRDDARRGHPGRAAARCTRRRRRRHRWRPRAHREHLDDGRDGGRRRGGTRREARQPGRHLGLRCRRPARGAGHPAGSRTGRRGPVRDRGGHRVLFRGAVPPRPAAHRGAAARAGRTHRVQLPRAAVQPGPAARRDGRLRGRAHGRRHGRGVRPARRLRPARPRRGRARRADDHRAHALLGDHGRDRHAHHDRRRRLRHPRARAADLRGADAAFNALVARRLLAGEQGPVRDAVLVNAAAALAAHAGLDGDLGTALREGLDRAAEAVDSGAARRTLDRWIATAQNARDAESA